jgi:hypothetical protein
MLLFLAHHQLYLLVNGDPQVARQQMQKRLSPMAEKERGRWRMCARTWSPLGCANAACCGSKVQKAQTGTSAVAVVVHLLSPLAGQFDCAMPKSNFIRLVQHVQDDIWRP